MPGNRERRGRSQFDTTFEQRETVRSRARFCCEACGKSRSEIQTKMQEECKKCSPREAIINSPTLSPEGQDRMMDSLCKTCSVFDYLQTHHFLGVEQARENNWPVKVVTNLQAMACLCPTCHSEADMWIRRASADQLAELYELIAQGIQQDPRSIHPHPDVWALVFPQRQQRQPRTQQSIHPSPNQPKTGRRINFHTPGNWR